MQLMDIPVYYNYALTFGNEVGTPFVLNSPIEHDAFYGLGFHNSQAEFFEQNNCGKRVS